MVWIMKRALIQYKYVILPVLEIPLWRYDGRKIVLSNGISYTGKITHLYWFGPQIEILRGGFGTGLAALYN